MNLDKAMELENLKQEHEKISKQIVELIMAAKHNYLNMAASEFRNFFQGKGFSVISHNGTNGLFTAEHGNLKVSLEIPKVENSYIGVYSVLELNISGPINATYIIPLNEFEHYPRMSSTISIAKQPRNEDERILQEIESEKKAINEAIESLEQKKKGMKMGFGRKDKNLKTVGGKYPQFETFRELLEDTFK